KVALPESPPPLVEPLPSVDPLAIPPILSPRPPAAATTPPIILFGLTVAAPPRAPVTCLLTGVHPPPVGVDMPREVPISGALSGSTSPASLRCRESGGYLRLRCKFYF